MIERVNATDLLYPELWRRVSRGLEIAHDEGIYAFVFETYRSAARQDELYAQGRTTRGPIVTRAKGWWSFHQYGLAVDLAFDSNPKTPKADWTWDGDWAGLGEIMVGQGLTWFGSPGSAYVETPHFQLTGGIDLVTAHTLALSGGLPKVWAAVDAWLGKGPRS